MLKGSHRQQLSSKENVAERVDVPADSKPFLNAFCTEAMHAARYQPCILDDTCA